MAADARFEVTPQYNVTHVGGECFQAVQEPSGQAVLWAELFRDKERDFLRKRLREETLTFSVHENYEVYVRCIWQPEAQVVNSAERAGKFALLLHEMRPPLTTSWTWAKFAKPLYRAGFSVIMVDLPGFGKSTVNQVALCPPAAWKNSDWQVIAQLLDGLRVQKVSTVCSGETCATIVKLMQRSPHQLTTEHYFRNPVFNRGELFKALDRRTALDAHRETSFAEELKRANAKEFCATLRKHGIRIWATFDKMSFRKTGDTLDLLMRTTGHNVVKYRGNGTPFMLDAVHVTELHEEDLAEAQVGVKLSEVRFLFPSYPFKNAVADFLSCTGKCADPANFKPAVSPTANASSAFSMMFQPQPPERQGMPPLRPSSASAPSLLPIEAGSSRGSIGLGQLDVTRLPSSTLRPPTGGSRRDGQDSRFDEFGQEEEKAKKRTFPKVDWKARNMNEAVIKAQMGIAHDASKQRQKLLTVAQRRSEQEQDVNPHLDKDLLDEEKKAIMEICKESIRTATQEEEDRRQEKTRVKALKQQTDQLNLSKGVFRYMRQAAKAMQKAAVREHAQRQAMEQEKQLRSRKG